LAVVLDINGKSGPVVMLPDLVQYLCLSEISCEWVMNIGEHKLKVLGVWDIYPTKVVK